MGRRVSKTVSNWDGSGWQVSDTGYFVYDGWNLIAELDETGGTEAAYVWGLDLSQSLQGAGGIGGLLARVDVATDKTHFYAYDGNGNVGQLVDAVDGSLAAAYEYDPYGNVVKAVGALAEVNPFRFSTKYLDSESGFYYYGYRYYVPELGRWLSRDPLGEEGGFNLYGFVSNNPNLYVDFSGLFGVFVHTKGAGHVGIQTIYNGSPRNYDFGRYHGRYNWSYKGPNILQRTTKKSPGSSNKEGYVMYQFDVSTKLDNIISEEFRGKYDSGEKDIPLNLKKKMLKYKGNKYFKINANERYMKNDWGLSGPNCVSFTFDTLREALDKVIEGKGYPEELKCEARKTKEKINEIKGMFTLKPSGVKDNLEEMFQ